jgi:taurine dehydrogenase small subunit
VSLANVELLRRLNEAFNRHDMDAFVSMLKPEVKFADLQAPADLSETVQGRELVARVVAQWAESFDEFGADVSEFVDAGDYVVCVARWWGKGRASGLEVENRGADLCRVEDGLVAEMTTNFKDRQAALDAIPANVGP